MHNDFFDQTIVKVQLTSLNPMTMKRRTMMKNVSVYLISQNMMSYMYVVLVVQRYFCIQAVSSDA